MSAAGVVSRSQRQLGETLAMAKDSDNLPVDPANSAKSEQVKSKPSYAGRPDQQITRNTGAGAGGATEWGGGNKNHPSRVKGKPGGSGG